MFRKKMKKYIVITLIALIILNISIRYVHFVQKGYAYVRIQLIYHSVCNTEDYTTEFCESPPDPQDWYTYHLICTPKNGATDKEFSISYDIVNGIQGNWK